jgi:hypothetical protein
MLSTVLLLAVSLTAASEKQPMLMPADEVFQRQMGS